MDGLNALFHSAVGINGFLDAFFLFCAVALPLVIVVFTILFFIRMHITRYASSKGIVQLKHFGLWLESMFDVLFATGGAWMLSEVVKRVVNTPRPYVLDPTLPHLLELPKYAAFPSSHTAVLVALALIVFYEYKRVGAFLLAAAIVVGFARVIVGVHSIEDIIGGIAVGVLAAFLVATIRRHMDHVDMA